MAEENPFLQFIDPSFQNPFDSFVKEDEEARSQERRDEAEIRKESQLQRMSGGDDLSSSKISDFVQRARRAAIRGAGSVAEGFGKIGQAEAELQALEMEKDDRSKANKALGQIREEFRVKIPELSREFEKSAKAIRVDPSRDEDVSSVLAEVVGSALPVLASGPAAPLVGPLQIGGASLQSSREKGLDEDETTRRFLVNTAGGALLNLVPIAGVQRAGRILDRSSQGLRPAAQTIVQRGGRVVVGTGSGATANLAGDVALQLAEGDDLDAKRVLLNAAIGGGVGAAVGASSRRAPSTNKEASKKITLRAKPKPATISAEPEIVQKTNTSPARESADFFERELRNEDLRLNADIAESARIRAQRDYEEEILRRSPQGRDLLRNQLELDSISRERDALVLERAQAELAAEELSSIPESIQLSPSAERNLSEFDELVPSGTRSRQQRKKTLRSRQGFISSELVLDPKIRPIAGGLVGAAYGATEGDTPEERLRNAAIYGASAAGLSLSPEIIRGIRRISRQPESNTIKPFPENAQITVQEYIGKDGAPKKAVQIDIIGETRDSSRSVSPEQLAEEGFDVPDFSDLPQGQYSSEYFVINSAASSATLNEASAENFSQKPLAPAVFIGRQQLPPRAAESGITGELFNLTEPLGNIPAGSSISRANLEKAGYFVPDTPLESSASPREPIALSELAKNQPTQTDSAQIREDPVSDTVQYKEADSRVLPEESGGGNQPPEGGPTEGQAQPLEPDIPEIPYSLYEGTPQRRYAELKSRFVDAAAPIEDTDRSFAKEYGTSVAPSQDLTDAIDRVYASKNMAGQFIEDYGLAKAIRSLNSKKDLDDFGEFLLDQHSLDVGERSGRDLAKAQANVDANKERFSEANADVRRFSDALLEKAKEGGIISESLTNKLRELYPNYVPLDVVFDELEKNPNIFSSGRGIASIGQQSAFRKLTGSNRKRANPLGSFLKKAEDVFVQVERNKAGKILADRRFNPGWEGIIREVPDSEINKSGAPENSFSYLEDGNKRVFEAPSEVVAAAKALNVRQLDPVLKALSFTMRLAKLGLTGINLPFALANISRDQFSTFVQSENSRQALRAFPGALISAIGHGDDYSQVVREGAMMTSFDVARDAPMQTVERIRAGRNIASKVAYTVTRPAELLRAAEDLVGRSEQLSRIQNFTSTLEANLAKGVAREDALILAARSARETTANYSRRGEWGGALNAGWLFLNAGIQASRATIRAASRNPSEFVAKVGVGLITPMAIATAWNLSDEQRRQAYEDIPEYEKQNNLILLPPIPSLDQNGRWNSIKIPLPPGLGKLASAFRRPFEQVMDSKETTAGEIAMNLLGSVSPIEPTGQGLLSNATPQIARPLAEIALNKNYFTNQELVPRNLQKLDPKYQIKKDTSATAIRVGQLLNVPPIWVDHVVKGYLGGVGAQGINLIDNISPDLVVNGEVRVGGRSIPEDIGRRFLSAAGNETLNELYAARDDAERAQNTYNSLIESGEESEADKFYAKNEARISAANGLRASIRQIRALSQDKDALSLEDKNNLNSQVLEISRDALSEYRKLTK
jgi:hypothetical protein